jgi:hypothetical protein
MPPPPTSTTRGILLAAALVVSPPAYAASPTAGGYGTVSLVVNLGPVPDRARLGVALEGGAQLFWHERPYYSDVANHLAPLATVSAHLAWTRPVTSAQVAVLGGAMYPLVVGDGGFIPLFGVQAGAGLGLATDGAAGLVLVGQLVGPYSEVRFDTVLWRKQLHAPRISAGFSLAACCGYYH